MKRALVPGTFDPITSGHLDVIKRAASLFDEVIVGVAASPKKRGGPLFTLEERVDLAREVTSCIQNVSVKPFECLLVNFAKQTESTAIVKGLRAISDFEAEFQMATLNRTIENDLETVFLMSAPQHMYISSSGVKEIASYGVDVSAMVAPCVCDALKKRFSAN